VKTAHLVASLLRCAKLGCISYGYRVDSII
jgi:hypothetical protein